jgi:hypothetical protein
MIKPRSIESHKYLNQIKKSGFHLKLRKYLETISRKLFNQISTVLMLSLNVFNF